MDRKPEENFLSVAIAGSVMLVCCLAPVLFIMGGAGLAAWFGGINPFLVAAIAVAACVAILFYLRMRKTASTETQHAPPKTALKGDQ